MDSGVVRENCGLDGLTNSEFVEAFQSVEKDLLGYARNLCRWDEDDAQNLFSEVIFRAFAMKTSFRPGTNFRAWTFRIMRNTFINSCTRRREVLVDLTECPSGGFLVGEEADTEDLVISRELSNKIIKIIDEKVNPLWVEILCLYASKNLGYRGIAEELGIPVGTVMSRLNRARVAVRKALEESDCEEIRNLLEKVRPV